MSSILQPRGYEKEIPLEVHFPKSDVRLGYASATQQALLNLSNALRYTDSGSVPTLKKIDRSLLSHLPSTAFAAATTCATVNP